MYSLLDRWLFNRFWIILPLAFFLTGAFSYVSAQTKWVQYQVGVGSGLARLDGGTTDLLPVDRIFPVHPEAAHYPQENVPVNGFTIPVTLEISREIKPWFHWGLNASYAWVSLFAAQEPPFWQANDTVQVRYRNSQGQWVSEARSDLTLLTRGTWKSKVGILKPTAYFDLAWKNEHSHFFLMVMPTLGYAHFETEASYQSQSGPSGGLASRYYVNRRYHLERKSFFYGLDLGLQWRDYFSERWGYALTASFMPWGRGSVHKVLARELLIHGESEPLPQTTIRPRQDFPKEPRGEFNFANSAGFYLSVFFRFNGST